MKTACPIRTSFLDSAVIVILNNESELRTLENPSCLPMSCQFWVTLIKYVIFRHAWPSETNVDIWGLKWPIMIQYRPIVFRYDQLWPCLLLYYQFLPILAHSVRFDHIGIKMPRKWPKMVYNDPIYPAITRYDQLWPNFP